MTYTKIAPIWFLLLLIISSTATAADKLEVHDAWVREAPPSVSVMAAYLTLHNHSAKGYTLVNLTSPDFKRVEMHRTEQNDGMSKMVPVSQVMLSPKGKVSFQPGAMHIMLMNPKKHFKAGDKIQLTLFFTDESSMEVSLPVKKATMKPGHHMHGDEHDMHSHQH